MTTNAHMCESASGRIKVVKVPDGEAPQWVRQAWVGITLPCKPVRGYGDTPSKGALSNTAIKNRSEYDVPQRIAIELLAQVSPRAAAWWRAHGFPQGGDHYFCFGAHEAEILSNVKRQKIIVCDNMETGHWCPTGTIIRA